MEDPRNPWTKKIFIRSSLAFLTLALVPALGLGARLAPESFRNVQDYVFSWWEKGVRNGADLTFDIKTSRYALVFDFPRLQVTRFFPLDQSSLETEALRESQAASIPANSPAASLEIAVESGGRRFLATGTSGRPDDCEFIEGGKFFFRRYLRNIRWEAGAPAVDTWKTGLDVSSWPDRLSLYMHMVPTQAISQGALEMTLGVDARYSVAVNPGGQAVGLKAADGSGFIFLSAQAGAALSLVTGQGKVKVRMEIGDWPAGQERNVGIIAYPVAGDFEARLSEALEQETKPLVITARQTAPSAQSLPVAYDRAQGWYRVGLRDDGGGDQRIERVGITVENPGPWPRDLRFNFAKDGQVRNLVGISAILRDSDGNPTGIPIALNKNWHRNDAEPSPYTGNWYHGFTLLTVPAGSTLAFEYTSVNAMWGRVAAASHAMLSVVGWPGSNQQWDQAAIGAWGEQICYEPDQEQARSDILDTRSVYTRRMDGNSGLGWTSNVGGGNFLVYYAPDQIFHTRMRTLYRRYSPNLTEVTYAGQTADGKVDLEFNTGLARSEDITRGLYRFRYQVKSNVSFNRMVFFQMGADWYSYAHSRQLARGNKEGLVQEWAASPGGNAYRTAPVAVTGESPWFSLHQTQYVQEGAGLANRGFVIRSWKARLGGMDNVPPYVAEYGNSASQGRNASSLIDIVPPPGLKQLQAGDYVEGEVILLVIPNGGEYIGPNQALQQALQRDADTWRMVHREAVGNDIGVQVTSGNAVVERLYPIRLKVMSGGDITFTVTGGLGYVPLTIGGLGGYRDPILQENAAGIWKTVDQSNHGKDFWQADLIPETRTWDITYNIDLDSPGDFRTTRTFRFTMTDRALGRLRSPPNPLRPVNLDGQAPTFDTKGRRRDLAGKYQPWSFGRLFRKWK